MNFLESYLARLTGRIAWPSVVATLESRLLLPSGFEGNRKGFSSSQYEMVTYEIDGNVYVAAIREPIGYEEVAGVGDTIEIQYNPQKPAQAYYAPACPLANKLVVGVALGVGALVIALAVSVFQRRT